MIKCKWFSTTSSPNVELAINEWLVRNPNYKIAYITQSSDNYSTNIIVWYTSC